MSRTAVKSSSAVRRLASRITIGLAALGTVAGVSMVEPATVSAHYAATSSNDVATSATHALWLLVHWQETGDPTDYMAYTQARLDTAASTAAQLGLSGAELDAEWGTAEMPKQHALLAAMSQLGVPYHSRMSKPGHGFDCSGLVLFAYGQAGIGLPRSSRDQIRAAAEVDRALLEPGDLVYYPGHISLYLGHDLVIHAPQPGHRVEVREMFHRSLRFGDALGAQP